MINCAQSYVRLPLLANTVRAKSAKMFAGVCSRRSRRVPRVDPRRNLWNFLTARRTTQLTLYVSSEMDELQLPDYVDENSVEYYDDPDDLLLYEDLEQMSKYGRFFYMFKSCVGPTTIQTVDLVGPLLAMCLILRVVSMLKLPRLVIHFVSFVCGLAALLLFTKKNSVYPLAMSALGYALLFVKNGKRGMVMAITSVTFIIVW